MHARTLVVDAEAGRVRAGFNATLCCEPPLHNFRSCPCASDHVTVGVQAMLLSRVSGSPQQPRFP